MTILFFLRSLLWIIHHIIRSKYVSVTKTLHDTGTGTSTFKRNTRRRQYHLKDKPDCIKIGTTFITPKLYSSFVALTNLRINEVYEVLTSCCYRFYVYDLKFQLKESTTTISHSILISMKATVILILLQLQKKKVVLFVAIGW